MAAGLVTKLTFAICSAGVLLHLYTAIFRAEGGASAFLIGLVLLSCSPYSIAAVISLSRRGKLLGLGGAAASLLADTYMHYSVFVALSRLRALNRALLAVALTLLLAGCGHDIWNAGDLAKWVRNEAVKRGCDPASVQLADWYIAKIGENVWPVECAHRQTGESMRFDVGVDKVWTPSQ